MYLFVCYHNEEYENEESLKGIVMFDLSYTLFYVLRGFRNACCLLILCITMKQHNTFYITKIHSVLLWPWIGHLTNITLKRECNVMTERQCIGLLFRVQYFCIYFCSSCKCFFIFLFLSFKANWSNHFALLMFRDSSEPLPGISFAAEVCHFMLPASADTLSSSGVRAGSGQMSHELSFTFAKFSWFRNQTVLEYQSVVLIMC